MPFLIHFHERDVGGRGKSGIIIKRDTGKSNEAYYDTIALLKIHRSVNWRMQVKIGR